jgi:ParB-like chromosome segregation protein Spo0J
MKTSGGVTIVSFPLDRLKPYARNPRKNDAVVGRMIGSIQEFGFKMPILIRSDGSVIDGHLRLKAAAQLGMTEVPAIVCDEWTEAQVKAFRLLANRSANWAEWDEELLTLEIEDLQVEAFDLALTGFDDKELEGFVATAAGANSDSEKTPAANNGGARDSSKLHEQFMVLITCEHEQQQTELLERFLAEGLTCRALTS